MTLAVYDDVPSAMDSEYEIISLALWSPPDFKRIRSILSREDFYSPILGEIWIKMCAMEERGDPVGPSTVMTQFMERGGAYVGRILEMTTNRLTDSGSLEYHCARIEEATIARDLQTTLVRIHQRAVDDWRAGDLGQGAVGVANDGVEELRVVQKMRQFDPNVDETDMLDVVSRTLSDDDWIIEQYLAHGERMIITAAEGWGKSTLIRQLAACIAAGVHPFTLTVTEPKRVLVVDAENPASINTVEWRRINDALNLLGENGRLPERSMMILKEIGPCNLLEAKQATKLYDAVDRLRPDVIFIGPLYQLFEGNPNDEEPAKGLARVLDKARMIHNSALVVEAHTPHSDHIPILRPFGASLWKRWPEFGFCLHDDGTTRGLEGAALRAALMMRESYFTGWRGARAMGRQWPVHLSAGQHLPWATVDAGAAPRPRDVEPQFLDEPLDDVVEDRQERMFG